MKSSKMLARYLIHMVWVNGGGGGAVDYQINKIIKVKHSI